MCDRVSRYARDRYGDGAEGMEWRTPEQVRDHKGKIPRILGHLKDGHPDEALNVIRELDMQVRAEKKVLDLRF